MRRLVSSSAGLRPTGEGGGKVRALGACSRGRGLTALRQASRGRELSTGSVLRWRQALCLTSLEGFLCAAEGACSFLLGADAQQVGPTGVRMVRWSDVASAGRRPCVCGRLGGSKPGLVEVRLFLPSPGSSSTARLVTVRSRLRASEEPAPSGARTLRPQLVWPLEGPPSGWHQEGPERFARLAG